MRRSLYYQEDSKIGAYWGINPYSDEWLEYNSLSRRISLKENLKWRKAKQFQPIIATSNLWSDFPARGFELVGAETKLGGEDQIMELLYLREDGGLLPCEFKIGRESKDTLGQLIRHMADLTFMQIDFQDIGTFRSSLKKWDSDFGISEERFVNFLNDNKIRSRVIRLLPKAGMIIDERFQLQLLRAVNYLNSYAGFSIFMVELQAFVSEEWDSTKKDYLVRIDFVNTLP